MEPKYRKRYVDYISQNASWFDRLRETNVWAELFQMSKQNAQKEGEKNTYS
jgi:hypothetical protein